MSEVHYSEEGDEVVLKMEHPIAQGRMREEVRLGRHADGLVSRSLTRELVDAGGAVMRREHVPDFHHAKIGLPQALYPEVCLLYTSPSPRD